MLLTLELERGAKVEAGKIVARFSATPTDLQVRVTGTRPDPSMNQGAWHPLIKTGD